MFKGREKELYIILSLPSVIYLQTKRKNMVYFFALPKSCVCKYLQITQTPEALLSHA